MEGLLCPGGLGWSGKLTIKPDQLVAGPAQNSWFHAFFSFAILCNSHRLTLFSGLPATHLKKYISY